jgi:hypothetical protein
LVVKGPVTLSSLYFLDDSDLEATILPECVVTLDIVKGEVTIPGVRGGSRELAEWGISEPANTLKPRKAAAEIGSAHARFKSFARENNLHRRKFLPRSRDSNRFGVVRLTRE